MSSELPKSVFSRSRSGFSLIDPADNKFYRRSFLTSGFRGHVAISYVWAEWKRNPSDPLPDWTAVRERLLDLLGRGAPKDVRIETRNATACWIDCKCIDQDSDADKAYWVPRMGAVYLGAHCTILLLRHLDLTVVQEVARRMSCPFKDKLNSPDELFAPHDFLLSQSCTVLPDLDPAQELACLDALRSLASGVWRRRAWILQEIFLSRNYLLSWGGTGWMRLADAAVIASVLARRHSDDALLVDLATWCRRLWFLRQNFGEGRSFELSDANVLQLSAGLEATVPADRFYALCGILGLENLQYNPKHSVDEALQNVVSELVRNGRLSWLYAIPPPVETSSDLSLEGDALAPFVLTRFTERLFANRHKMRMDNGLLAFQAREVGRTVSAQPLREFLAQAVDSWNESRSSLSPPPPESLHLVSAPAIIHRLTLDIMAPLMTEAMIDLICAALGIAKETGSRNVRSAAMIMSLYARGIGRAQSSLLTDDKAAIQIADGTANALRDRISEIMDSFSVVNVSLFGSNGGGASQETLIGFRAAAVGSGVYSVLGDSSLVLLASQSQGNNNTSPHPGDHAAFRGMLFRLKVSDTIGPQPSSLFQPASWSTRGHAAKATFLTFPYRAPPS